MSRLQSVLGGLLLVQAVLILAVRPPWSPAHAHTTARPLVEGLETLEATRLQIGSEDERMVTLIRGGDGWTIQELGGMPADDGKVEELIGDVTGVRVRRPVVDSKRYHGKFRVGDDDNEGRLRIWDASADTPRIDLIVGTSVNYRTSHVRLAGENAVYEARNVASHEVQPDTAAWFDKELVNVAQHELTGLRLANAAGSFELQLSDGAWTFLAPETLAGRSIESSKLDTLLREARTIRLADPVGPLDETAQGLSSPAATLTLRVGPSGTDAGAELEVKIGAKVDGDETQRYVSRGGSGFTGTVWESSVETLLEQRGDDLVDGA